jgi:hypothetical protein
MHVRTICWASITRGCRKNKMTEDFVDLGGASYSDFLDLCASSSLN